MDDDHRTLFGCHNLKCPESNTISGGFSDKNSRTEHERMCSYNYEAVQWKEEKISDDDDKNPIWMDMILKNNNSSGEVSISQVVEEVNRSMEAYGIGSYWGESENVLDDVGYGSQLLDLNLNLTPLKEVLGNEAAATSIWDLTYDDEEDS